MEYDLYAKTKDKYTLVNQSIVYIIVPRIHINMLSAGQEK